LFVFSTLAQLPHRLGTKAYDLMYRRDFDLRLPLMKLNRADDSDDFSLLRGDPLVDRNFLVG
jgi:hypothetical protein